MAEDKLKFDQYFYRSNEAVAAGAATESSSSFRTRRRRNRRKPRKETRDVDPQDDSYINGVVVDPLLHTCPYAATSDCLALGDIPYLINHLRNEHGADLSNSSTLSNRYINSDPRLSHHHDLWVLTVCHCYNEYFCVHFEAFEFGTAPVYMAFVLFVGEESDACKFRYSLEVGGTHGHGRKLMWEGRPRSIRDGHLEVRDSHDGLLIPRDLAHFFSDGGDNLNLLIRGRIWKEEANGHKSGVDTNTKPTTTKLKQDEKPDARIQEDDLDLGDQREEANDEKSDMNGDAGWQEIGEFKEHGDQECDGFIVVL